MIVHWLRFADVDPARVEYDPVLARRLVEEVVGQCVGGNLSSIRPAPRWDRDKLQEVLEQRMADAFGPWASGFTWAASEPGGGGPVKGYCCPRDSLLAKGDKDARATVDRVVAALDNWRGFLVELTSLFETIRHETSLLPTDRAVEHAASRILPVVIERTSADDAWYNTFCRVLSWYLESCGHDPGVIDPLIRNVVRGHFHSWVEPEAPVAGEACAELGLQVALADTTPQLVDALAEWRSVREKSFNNPPAPYILPMCWDGHLRFIQGRERARDPQRAIQMQTALHACRNSALRNRPLTWERLVEWQALVLNQTAPTFRTTDAFAKGGRERYGRDEGTQKRFMRWLADANDSSVPVHVRAARVYLDICFTHPFADGNARSARLALDYVLAREKLFLRTVEPLFVLARSPLDADGAWCMAWLVGRVAGKMA